MKITKKEILFEQKCRKVRSLFWEFYALDYLNFTLGNGRELYGYPPIFPVNSRLSERIAQKFEKTTDNFFLLTQKSLEESIRSEMRYIFRCGPYMAYDAVNTSLFEKDGDSNDVYMGINDTLGKRALRNLTKYLRRYNPKIKRNLSPRKAPIEWGKIAFSWDGWGYSYCGQSWYNACEFFLKSKKISNLKDKIAWIDDCLDLYHNNGPLLDKTPFVVLHEAGDLDTRFELKSWVDAIKNNKIIEEFVECKSEHNLITCVISQEEYPVSFFTKSIIKAYTHKLI